MYNFPSIRKTGDDGSAGWNGVRIQQRPIHQAHHGQSTNYDGGLMTLALTLATVNGGKK